MYVPSIPASVASRLPNSVVDLGEGLERVDELSVLRSMALSSLLLSEQYSR